MSAPGMVVEWDWMPAESDGGGEGGREGRRGEGGKKGGREGGRERHTEGQRYHHVKLGEAGCRRQRPS